MPRAKKIPLPVDPANPDAPPPTRWRFPGVPGSVENRNGCASYRIGSRHIAAGFEFIEANRKRAERELKALQNRRRELVITQKVNRLLGIRTEVVEATPTMTIFDAQKAFTKAKLKGRPKKTTDEYLVLWREVFPTPLTLEDKIIEKRVEEWHDGLSLAPGTLRRRLSKLTKFLDFCRDKGWLASNPMADITAPPRPRRARNTRAYRPEERARILEYFRKKIATEARYIDPRTRNAEQYVALWPFQWLALTRIGETLSLKWEEYVVDRDSENYITSELIILNDTKTDNPRTLPYRLFPELAAVIESQRRFAEINDGYVFPWRSIQVPAKALRKAFEAIAADPKNPCTIDGSNRPIHKFRATGEEMMRQAGYSEAFFTKWAGHGLPVYERDYATRTDANEIAALATKERAAIALAQMAKSDTTV